MEMDETGKRCTFVWTGTSKARCTFQNYEGHEYCIFHCPKPENDSSKSDHDRDLFRLAFVDLVEKNSALRPYLSFNGFVFPSINFKRLLGHGFDRPIYFRKCTFQGNTNFRECRFSERVEFAQCEFLRFVRFNACEFLNRAIFKNCTFVGNAGFHYVRFSGTTFEQCEFVGRVSFHGSEFSHTAAFTSSRFLSDAIFRSCKFADVANFEGSSWMRRADFRNAVFTNEISLNQSHFALLKSLDGKGAVFDGAILDEAHFWNILQLTNCSFRDAFLMSVSFADRKINDCDFTGAVFKAVLTQGWKPDSKTIENTQYIYTDYEVSERNKEADQFDRVYKRVEDSRVPAEGTFGRGEHANFTIADYLKEPLKWSLALNVPANFRTAVLNYIQFFTDFMKITEGVSLEIRTRQEGSKLRVEFMTDTAEDKELVKDRFKQYRNNTTREFASLDFRFNSNASDVEKELFRIRYEHTINSLKTELGYTQRLLEKEEEKNALQEKYLSLLREAGVFSKESPRLLMPPLSSIPQRSRTPIFFLTADLKDYSKATQEDSRLYPAVQAFLFDQKALIEKDPVCEAVKLEGDSIKVFFRDGLKLIWIVKRLLHDFERLKYDQPTTIKGFRVVLGYGTGYREQRGDDVDYSGNFIVETCRVDKPMKKYIDEHNENPNQVWCTEAFQGEVYGKHSNLVFEELPPVDLDKGYGAAARLFRVTVE